MYAYTLIDLRFTVRASPIPGLHLLQNQLKSSSLRCISTELVENQGSITASYLMDSYGLSARSTKELLRIGNPDDIESVLSFFKEHGFSETQITKIINRNSGLLLSNPDETVLPLIEFFRFKGLSNSEIAKLFTRAPRLLQMSLENDIIPSFNVVEDLVQSEERAIAAIKFQPCLLWRDIKTIFPPKINYFRGIGMSEPDIVRLIHFGSYILFMDLDKVIKKAAEEAITLGFDPSKSKFRYAILVLVSMKKSTMERKFLAFKRWNWSEEDILAAFRKQPWILEMSEKKIAAAMDYFVNQLGWKSSTLAKYPGILLYSLKKRLIPRTLVWQFLVKKGLMPEQSGIRYYKFFLVSEKSFLKDFVHCYREAPQILEIYKKKLDCS